MQAAVDKVIENMWTRYQDPLSLRDLAGDASFSRFYLSRQFRRITGTTPFRFLYAIRLYRAKNLLLATSLTVTEIAFMVGYNSLGTFSSRFNRSVGMSPARYRDLCRSGSLTMVRRPPHDNDRVRAGALHGHLNIPPTGTPYRVYVGAFCGPIPEGVPISCDMVDSGETYRLDALPEGEWHIWAAAVALVDNDPRPWHRRPIFVGTGALIKVPAGDSVTADIDLRPSRPTDLPILLALPELDSCRMPDIETELAYLELVRDPAIGICVASGSPAGWRERRTPVSTSRE